MPLSHGYTPKHENRVPLEKIANPNRLLNGERDKMKINSFSCEIQQHAKRHDFARIQKISIEVNDCFALSDLCYFKLQLVSQ